MIRFAGRAILFLGFFAGCHGVERRPDATLALRVHQAQAAVYVDDAVVQVAPEGSKLKLFAGFHRIEVRAPGCFTAYREVSVPPGETREVDLALKADPDAEGEPACAPAGSGESGR